jgi:predicted NAD/FAD-dependent oxidoreductase
MSSLAEHLAADMALHSSIQVTAVTRKDTRWQLSTATDVLCSADAVVIALPASQVGALLSDLSADTRAALTAVQFAPCWAVMANAADPARDPGFDAAFISDGPLSWACRQIGKPGRSGTGWVLHGSPEWSTQFIDAPPEQVGAVLTEDFSRRFDIELLSNPVAHRWRFARVTQPAGRQPCLIDGRSGLVMCGDWCNGTRVEDAYLSGLAAGETVQAALAGSATRQRP